MKTSELRQSILQAAVQGKLVPQDSHDEPASESLARIRAEKALLIREGKIKKTKSVLPIAQDNLPYDLPDGWTRCRLQDVVISDITYGIIKLGDEDNNGVKVIRCSDVKPGYIDQSGIRTVTTELSEEYSRTILQGGEILVNVRGTLGGVAIASDKFRGYNIAREVALVRCSNQINLKYMLAVLMSPLFGAYLSENLRGTAYKGLNMNLLSMFEFPLPPHIEQKRIVVKVEELMTLCDDLEASENELEKLEEHLIEYLPISILQMAVQGKLVPQDLHDEPASELLKNIPAEKAKFIKESKLKKEKSLPAITEDEIPYDLPEGWVWCRLNDIATIYTGNSINENEKKNKYTDLSDGYSYIATKDINFNGSVNYESGVKIPYNTSLKVAHKNNVLICTEGGSAGRKIAIINHNVCFVNKLCCLCGHMVNPRYLYYYLRSMVFQLQFTAAMTGIIGGVGLSAMKHLIIPIPPLAEQQRIVAKVGELMVLCEKLKSAKTSPVKTVEPKIVPFPQAEPEEEIEIAARGDAEDLPREALDDLTELFGDGKND